MSSLPYSVMDQINLKPIYSTKTIKISSRTSVQSELILTSDGDPALKYKPVILYRDKDYKRIVNCFKRAGYSLDIMRQTACLVFNPIMVEGYAALFSCTAVVQASDSMTASI